MNTEQALKVLIEAVQVGQSRGAYRLDEAVTIKSAVDVFYKPQETDEATPEVIQLEAETETSKTIKKSKSNK